jgi:hypothetical protein
MIDKLNGWKDIFLSMGGEEILLKAIIQSFLVFALGVFKLPKHFWKKINNARATFLWGDSEEQKKMHWSASWRMCVL